MLERYKLLDHNESTNKSNFELISKMNRQEIEQLYKASRNGNSKRFLDETQ